MPQSLPPGADLAWLTDAVAEKLAALWASEPAAEPPQAELELARDYGFATWQALIAHVDPESLDRAIVAAAAEGRAGELARLLGEHPEKLHITGGSWNRPLLHLAAEGGHLDCVDLLLQQGFDVHRRDLLDNATALHWAAEAGHLAVVKRLVEVGADIEGSGDEHEMGVIGWATSLHKVQADVAEFLLQRGAKPSVFAAVALGRADLVRELVKSDPGQLSHRMSRFEHLRTPLHFAVRQNNPDMVDLLLELGADVSAKDAQGRTPLGAASAKTDVKIVDRLVASGADPAELKHNRFGSAVPILNVGNVPASLAYYIERLGFLKEWDWASPPTFACVRRDDVRIFLCQGGQGAPGTWISIFIDDVDALYETYQSSGAIIREPPADFPWGLREMNVEDLDGHRLRMGSAATGAPPSEAA